MRVASVLIRFLIMLVIHGSEYLVVFCTYVSMYELGFSFKLPLRSTIGVLIWNDSMKYFVKYDNVVDTPS